MKTQVIRGAIGLSLLVAAGFLYRDYYALSFLCVLLSFIPMRGCPVCWTLDTAETVKNASKDKDKDGSSPRQP